MKTMLTVALAAYAAIASSAEPQGKTDFNIRDYGGSVARAAEAAARKEVLSITSHGISPDAKGINMKTDWLERILATAKESGLAVIGFDELPAAW